LLPIYLFCCIFQTASAVSEDDNQRRRSRRQQEDDAEGTHAFALLVGALLGSFAYPLLFLLATQPFWKFVTAYSHHIVLRGKALQKGREFLMKVLFSLLGDIVGVEDIDTW